jgi:hypothetical protein
MKTTITSLSMLLFVGAVHAASDAEIYHGFAQGNPDLSSDVVTQIPFSLERVSDNDIYRGFEFGNLDLSTDVVYEPMRMAMAPGIGDSHLGPIHNHATENDIYHGFEIGNPDL